MQARACMLCLPAGWPASSPPRASFPHVPTPASLPHRPFSAAGHPLLWRAGAEQVAGLALGGLLSQPHNARAATRRDASPLGSLPCILPFLSPLPCTGAPAFIPPRAPLQPPQKTKAHRPSVKPLLRAPPLPPSHPTPLHATSHILHAPPPLTSPARPPNRYFVSPFIEPS